MASRVISRSRRRRARKDQKMLKELDLEIQIKKFKMEIS